MTEGFTRAIDQLGREQLDVRLGGVYSLERIARDSEDDRPVVFEVLSAFVREHAGPVLDEHGQPLRQPTDVQAALTVLERHTTYAE